MTWSRPSENTAEWNDGRVWFRVQRFNGWVQWFRLAKRAGVTVVIAQGLAPTSEMACAEAAGTFTGSVERRKR